MILTQAVSRIVSFCRAHRKTQAFIRAVACTVLAAVFASSQITGATIVRMETSVGSFHIELYDTETPITVTNFLNYVNRGDYDGTVIHRSVPGFVIQGGGYVCCNFVTQNLFHINEDPPIQNEFDPSRSNIRGTIAMAKTSDPDSATSEWFVNIADNSASLDDINNSGGFTVFGHVLDPGMNVFDEIATLPRLADLDIDTYIVGFPELPIFDGQYFVMVNRACVNNDSDGACTDIENLAPGEDGNGDGSPDRDQSHVTTIQTLLGTTVTFAAEPGMSLDPVYAVSASTATSLLAIFKSPPDQSVHFNNGMHIFSMTGVIGPAGSVVTIHDGASARPTHYYAFGPTPDNPSSHWYDFSFDGETGAEIKDDRIILHFIDGKRGDDDLTANDSITHTGAQAVLTPTTSADAQSGGCSITTGASRAWRGGDWALVFVFLIVLTIVRKRTRRN